MIEILPRGKRIVNEADLKRHVGQSNKRDDEVLERHGVKNKNPEGQMVLEFEKNKFMCGKPSFPKERRALSDLQK